MTAPPSGSARSSSSIVAALVARWPALPWVAPFAVFMLLLAGLPALGVPEPWQGALRLGVPALVLLTLSRAPLASCASCARTRAA